MFEVKVQTYWADADSVGIIFFPHFFRFVEQAEEELFRAAGADRHGLLEANSVWMPRVEAFSKFLKPIKCGAAIRIRLNPQLKGEKTIRYEYQILDDATGEPAAEGDFAEVRIPRLLHYEPAPPNAERVRLGVYEFLEEDTGKVALFRFYSLEPAE